MEDNQDVQTAGARLLKFGEDRLSEIREIHPPHTVKLDDKLDYSSGTDHLTSFPRAREIPIPWSSIIGMGDALLATDELANFKDRFEESWGGSALFPASSISQFFEIAPADIGRRLLGAKPRDVLLYVPGLFRLDIRPSVAIDLDSLSTAPAAELVNTNRYTAVRYLGPDSRRTWRYFKLNPSATPAAPTPLDFWMKEKYEASWGNVGQIEEVFPVEIRYPEQTPMNPSASSSLPPQKFFDREAQEQIKSLVAAAPAEIQRAKQNFELVTRGLVREEGAAAPISLSKAKEFFTLVREPNGGTKKQEVPVGQVLLRILGKPQVYHVQPVKNEKAMVEALYQNLSGRKGAAEYDRAWSEDISAIDPVHTEKEIDTVQTQETYLDLMSEYIRQHFWIIDGRIGLMSSLATQAKQELEKRTDVAAIGKDELEQLVARYTDFQTSYAIALAERRRLEGAARVLGYVLITDDKGRKVTIPTKSGPQEKLLAKGELYRPVVRKDEWFETRKLPSRGKTVFGELLRRVAIPGLPLSAPLVAAAGMEEIHAAPAISDLMQPNFKSLGKVRLNVLRPKLPRLHPPSPTSIILDILTQPSRPGRTREDKVTVTYEDFEVENAARLGLDGTISQLQSEEFTVFVFALTDDGYRDRDGKALTEIVTWCGLDEAFRLKCAVLIPKYRNPSDDPLQVVGYHIFKRPRPGEALVQPPKLWIQDKLSFVTKWLGTELGVPVQSINLAPGESRKISVTQEQSASTHFASEAITEFDLTESASTSFESEFERTLRREQQQEKTSNWNANVSGNYGGVISGGASGGGTSKKSVTEFAQDIQRTAHKAAAEVTRKSRSKITTSRTVDTSSRAGLSSSSEVANINAGATLNLTFYQLNNVFGSAVLADKIRFGVSSGVEIIEGTGIVEPRLFDARNLEEAFGHMLSGESFRRRLSGYVEEITMAALTELIRVLEEDYMLELGVIDSTDSELVREMREVSTSNALPIEIFNKKWSKMPVAKTLLAGAERPSEFVAGIEAAAKLWAEVIESRLSIMTKALDRWARKPQPIAQSLLHLPSAAMYLDAKLGEGRSTEIYSEMMRHAEWEEKRANTDAVVASAEFERAKAHAFGENKVIVQRIYRLAEPKITSTEAGVITLSGPLPAGTWVLAGESDIVVVPEEFVGKAAISLKSTSLSRKANVTLVEIRSGIYIER